ncbi:RNA polymerase sigma factor [Candidatus Sumerlaeota bacterium]|nr:RNA polymerase sigma factor [Candidatus Sumerlaeota bacterium]
MTHAIAQPPIAFSLAGFPWARPIAVNMRDPAPSLRGATAAESAEETQCGAARHDGDDLFIEAFESHYEAILNFLYRRTGDVTTSEDLTSETFLKALEQHRRNGLPEHIRPWLYRVAINADCSRRRRWGRFLARTPLLAHGNATASNDAFEALAIEQDAARARSALNQLPERYRLPLQLRYDEELTTGEIAAIMQLEETTVRSRIFRGLRKLKQALRNDDRAASGRQDAQ